MSQASQDIAQQFIDGGVVPAELAGQDGATKTYVNSQLAMRDQQIAAGAQANAATQTGLNTHVADTTVHVLPIEKAAYNGHIADPNIHVNAAKKTEWDGKAPGRTQTDLVAHTGNSDIHTTALDKKKLLDIQAGAEVNQNTFSYVNDVGATTKKDTLFIVGGIGITVSTDPVTKRVTVTATGSATPGPHASTHITGGADRIPDAVTGGNSGLMSGADAQFVRVDGETKTGAQAKVDALAGVGNTKTVKQLDDALSLQAADTAKRKSDYEYQTASVVGRQIRLVRQSSTNRIVFKLSADIASGAALTISLDGGVTSLPLQDFNGVAVTELTKGFMEVVADATFFTLRSSKSSGSSVKSVQRGYQSMTSGVTKNITITNVNLDKSVVMIETAVAGSPTADTIQCMARLINSNTLEISRITNNNNGLDIFWTVIEFDGVKSIQRYTGEIQSEVLTMSTVNTSKSLVFGSRKSYPTQSGSDVTSIVRNKYFLNANSTVSVLLSAKIYRTDDVFHIQLIEFN